MEELWDPDPDPEPESVGKPPRFSVVWRGYDRHQVDTCVRALLASPGRPLSEVSAGPGGLGPVFDVVLRGYARHEVEQYLGQFPR